MRSTVFVMLGRAGDVINLLPVVRRFKETTGEQPLFLVGAEFAPILDGVSYCEPLVWTGPWQDCVAAIKWAQRQVPGAEIVNAAVYGIGYFPITRMASFDREAWDRAGCDVPWGRAPLVFDRRDATREAALVSKLPGTANPIVLTAFAGHSSPFNAAPAVFEALARDLPEATIVDISVLRADRIFDLLGLFERAAVLVAGDSAPMHLAAAVPDLPVVMMTQDAKHRWHRSSWRPQHAARLFYSEATIDPGTVVSAVRAVLERKRRPKFLHVYGLNGAADSETQRREAIARASWREEMTWSGRWSELAIPEAELHRNATALGDDRRMPFVRDLIEAAVSRCAYSDVIVLSNSDVGIAPGLTGWIVEAMIRAGAAFTHRWDRHGRISRPPVSEGEVCEGHWYPGSDLFAFTRAWWEAWGDRVPDLVLGREAVDLVLRHVIKQGGGIEIPGAVWHERHASHWETVENRNSLAGNLHNRVLATTFLREFGGSWNDGVEVRPGLK
jgi:hypothetical protein